MLIGTDQNNAIFWGWNNRSTVRNVSILLILLCIGLVSILFFLEETDNDTAYVFFESFTFTRIFNKLDIQTTYMYTYSSSTSLVTHSLIHTLNQDIMHTYVTLELQGQLRGSQKENGKYHHATDRCYCSSHHWIVDIYLGSA